MTDPSKPPTVEEIETALKAVEGSLAVSNSYCEEKGLPVRVNDITPLTMARVIWATEEYLKIRRAIEVKTHVIAPVEPDADMNLQGLKAVICVIHEEDTLRRIEQRRKVANAG